MLSADIKKRANLTFYQFFSIGVSFFAVLVFVSIKVYPKLFLFWQSFLGQLETICGCTNHFSFAMHPWLFSSLTILGLLIFLFFCFALAKIVRSMWLTNRFIKMNLRSQKKKAFVRLQRVAESLGLERKIIEIDQDKPIIFCFGLIRPRICISSGLIRKLSNQELKAVLLHEQHHLLTHEPLKMFVVKLVTKILFFLPGLRSFSRQYLVFSELAADQWATNNFQDKVSLAQALYKVIKWKKDLLIRNDLALSFFASSVIEERVNKLADAKYNPTFKLFTSKLGIAACLVFFLALFSGWFLTNGPVMASYESSSCLTMQPTGNQQCEVSLSQSVCDMDYSLESSSCQTLHLE